MSDLYVSSYADRGTLRDLEELDIDTSKIDPAVLDLGRVGGTLYGITHGTGMYALVANVDLFEEYGVELPDDDTWTWDDYAAVAQELTEKSDGAITGSDQTGGFDVHGLRYWIRSAGGELFDDEGDVAMDPQALADMWQFELDLQESGGMLSASAITESFNAGISGNALASKQVALGVATDNQLTALQESTGSELRLLKLPEPEGVHPAFFGPTMYWSVATTSKHPAEAALLADFLANSQAAGEIIQTERGLPANSEVRAAISADLPAAAQAAIEFEESVETGEAPLVAPNGASTLETILQRYTRPRPLRLSCSRRSTTRDERTRPSLHQHQGDGLVRSDESRLAHLVHGSTGRRRRVRRHGLRTAVRTGQQCRIHVAEVVLGADRLDLVDDEHDCERHETPDRQDLKVMPDDVAVEVKDRADRLGGSRHGENVVQHAEERRGHVLAQRRIRSRHAREHERADHGDDREHADEPLEDHREHRDAGDRDTARAPQCGEMPLDGA
jgi:multiple sugar transport system substrate-binding protein